MTDTQGIDPQSMRTILELYDRLGALTHYEVLGVAEEADRREIRAKFHELVNRFHPDRFYGRDLGAFKTKLERVFQRMTEAHDVLSRTEPRAEYDAYLRRERGTRALENTLNDEAARARELRDVQAGIEAEARTKSSPHMVATRVDPPRAAPPPRVEAPRMDPEARKRALARKLGRSQPPPSPTQGSRASAPEISAPPPGAPSDTARARMPSSETISAAHQRAAQELRARYERHLLEARTSKIRDYELRSEEALKAGKLVEAVNTLRIASQLGPEDVKLKERLTELEQRVNDDLARRYLEQAEYEEREHRWDEAARSYQKAQRSRPLTPKQRERFIACLLRGGVDVRLAIENARQAVLEAPNDTKSRKTLARAYLAANMRESALGELERAAAIAPKDDSIKDLIRRVRRGETPENCW